MRARLVGLRPLLALVVAALGLILTNTLHEIPADAAGTPPGRTIPSMASDPATGNVVMFGGVGHEEPGDQAHNLDDTWVWNGRLWKEANPPTKPLAQGAAAMAADPVTKTVVLFARGAASSETWLWDGLAKSWTLQITPVSPPRMGGASIAFDKATGTVVLFGGGAVDGHSFGDTWVWDGRTKIWTLKQPPVRPPARADADMATDASTGTVVLFGGETFHHGGTRLGDTWVWDGVSGTWTEQTPLVSPTARIASYMAYHPPTKKVVLFGGNDGIPTAMTARADTWTWDGQSKAWTKQKPTERPCSRDQGEMAYHAGTRTDVIFGGAGDSPCPGTTLPRVQDTWAWDGVNWQRKA